MKCADISLEEFVSGHEPRPGDTNTSSIVQHLDNCSVCRTRAEQLFAEDETACELKQILTDTPEQLLCDVDYEATWTDLPALQSGHENDSMVIGNSTPNEAEISKRLAPSSHPETLGRLGRYEVESIIGQGGMGVVLRAYDTDLHRVVALKILADHLSSSAAARNRFAREARAAAAVLHPNVLPIHDVEASEGQTPYLVMQYIAGESLQARVVRSGTLPIGDALRIGKQTAEALAAAHEQGLIHRDVKPANILLEERTDRVVLGDFGLARTSDEASLTRTGVISGTPHYMSPEQATGETVSSKSDQFALGCIMYFMLAGHPPFRAETALGVLHCVTQKRALPLHTMNPDVPREVSTLVDRMLAKKPSQRYPTTAAVVHRFEKLLADYQSGSLQLVSNRRRLTTTVVIALSAALLVTTSMFGLLPALDWTAPNLPQQSTARESALGDGSAERRSGLLPTPDVSRTADRENPTSPSSTVANVNSDTAKATRTDLFDQPDNWNREFAKTRIEIMQFERAGLSDAGAEILSDYQLQSTQVWLEELNALHRRCDQLEEQSLPIPDNLFPTVDSSEQEQKP